MSDPAAARRMVNTVPEEEEAAEQRRYHRYHEMLWEHIEGATSGSKAIWTTTAPLAPFRSRTCSFIWASAILGG
jgi:hypothetical protein